MSIVRSERYAGILLVQEDRLDWRAYRYDKRDGVLVCGEINHVKHLFWKYAWGLMVRRDMKVVLAELAKQVGVEYLGPGTTATNSTEATP